MWGWSACRGGGACERRGRGEGGHPDTAIHPSARANSAQPVMITTRRPTMSARRPASSEESNAPARSRRHVGRSGRGQRASGARRTHAAERGGAFSEGGGFSEGAGRARSNVDSLPAWRRGSVRWTDAHVTRLGWKSGRCWRRVPARVMDTTSSLSKSVISGKSSSMERIATATTPAMARRTACVWTPRQVKTRTRGGQGGWYVGRGGATARGRGAVVREAGPTEGVGRGRRPRRREGGRERERAADLCRTP